VPTSWPMQFFPKATSGFKQEHGSFAAIEWPCSVLSSRALSS
jgi:hypothetical protein